MKLNKTKILKLAVEWNKCERTIRRWLKTNSPMLEHPNSIKIIKGK